MRIEIASNASRGTSTISGLYTDFDSLLDETDSVIDALQKMKSFSHNMSGGIGTLHDAIGNVDTRILTEQQKQTNISQAKEKCGSFLKLVSSIDSRVAKSVSQNQDEFYRVNQWAAPFTQSLMMDSWYQSATKWLKDSIHTVGDMIEHSYQVYTETDFSSMSEDELLKYTESLADRIHNSDSDNDDAIRLTTLENYITSHLLHNKRLFLSIYERLYPEKIQLIQDAISKRGNYNEKQQVAIAYFMANGSSLSTSITLCRESENVRNVIEDQYELMTYENGDGFKQGNFWIGNFDVSETIDGSCKIKAVARQSSVAKSEGAVIVYDGYEHIVDVQVLNRYKNPIDFVSAIQTIWKDWHGEDYEETKIDIIIPKGGYAQITDDPDILQYVQGDILRKKTEYGLLQDASSKAENVQDLIMDDIKVVGTQDPSYIKYGDEISNYISVIEKSHELVDDLEAYYWSNRQKGAGSCYIYNH